MTKTAAVSPLLIAPKISWEHRIEEKDGKIIVRRVRKIHLTLNDVYSKDSWIAVAGT